MENPISAICSQLSADSYLFLNKNREKYSDSVGSDDSIPSSKSTISTPLFLSIQAPEIKHTQWHSVSLTNNMSSPYSNNIQEEITYVTEEPDNFFSNTSSPDLYENDEQKFYNGYGEWGHVINHTERTIIPDLKSYMFPDDIKNQADTIYNKMRYQVRRGKIRNQMLFFCVYNAHIELGRDVNPIQLGAQFGLNQGEVQRCDSLFSPLQTGYRPPSKNTSPLGYLPDYCQNMDLSQEAIDEMMKMSVNILHKEPALYQENPQTVAAGLLRYFTVTNGVITDDPQKITRVTNRSTVTIDGMFRRISAIDNS
jgi:hypothetical protein